jgi:hypothetical protein
MHQKSTRIATRSVSVEIELCGDVPLCGYSKKNRDDSRVNVLGGKQLLLEFWEAGVSLGKSCKTR